jgi:hypothetical protein
VAEDAHVFWKLAHKDQKATDDGRLGIFTNGSFAPGRLDGRELVVAIPIKG